MSDEEINEQSEAGEAGGEQSADGYTGSESVVVSESRPSMNGGTLAMFAVLIVGAAGLYLMYRQAGPKSASASIAPQTVEANKTISKFLSGGDANIKSMETLIRNTEKVVAQFLAYPSMTQIPLGDLRTNPFRRRDEITQAAKTSSLPDLSGKRRDEERQTVLKAVQGLQLQSIMCGETRKACMINNALYREGQVCEEFTIEKISPASVVVKNGSYRFELRMQK
jgi:hypothetical protein